MGNNLEYGGVRTNKKAAGGIGCIFSNESQNKIRNWKTVSERILQILIIKKEGESKENDNDRSKDKRQIEPSNIKKEKI